MERAFAQLGFKIIFFNDVNNANGVDMYVQAHTNKRPLSVEIKKASYQRASKSLRVEPVLHSRKGDDLVAILVKGDYVLIQSMEEHLKCCNKSGYRNLTIFNY